MEAESMRSAVPSIRAGRDFRAGIMSGASQGRRCRECSLSCSSKKSHMHLAGVTFWSGVPWSKSGKKTQGMSPFLYSHGEVPLPSSNERLQKLISGASQGRKHRECCSSCSCWQRPLVSFQGERVWLGLAPEVSQGRRRHIECCPFPLGLRRFILYLLPRFLDNGLLEARASGSYWKSCQDFGLRN